MAYYVYILCCGDGSLYTGSTNDVDRRLRTHQSGRGAKYTRSRLPVTLVYRERLADRSTALRREAAIKRLTRERKLALIAEKETVAMREIKLKARQTSEEAAWNVVDTCPYAVLAMTTEDGTPYSVPVTIVRRDREVYFHCAQVGWKVECLRSHPKVCLTCVSRADIDQDELTVRYDSAVAFGAASEITDPEEKAAYLRLLCARHAPDNPAGMERSIARSLAVTGVWKITVESITGKHN